MKTNVLVVDGDASVRESLAKVLALAGYDVTTVAHSRDAAELLDPEQTRLVILNLDLPFQHALAAFGPLASLNAGVPILLITDQPDECPASLIADVAALIEKPVDVDLLLDTVEELVAEPRPLRIHAGCNCHNHSWHEPAGRRLSPLLATPLRSP